MIEQNCNHPNATQYFGPIYHCPDCGATPTRDINAQELKWWRDEPPIQEQSDG